MFWVGLALGSLGSSACWWLYVRHLSGVISDLKNVVNDIKTVQAKASTAADQVTAAAKTISS